VRGDEYPGVMTGKVMPSGRRYYAGNLTGKYNHPEDGTRCIAEVQWRGYSFPRYSQCRGKRGKGPGGLFCAIHAKVIEREKAR